jgi:predicted AlkP superfamily pyrophosphatase or phosphodiesterase
MRFILFLLLFCLMATPRKTMAQTPAKPKLIVGIVVDQMRFEYLYRYQNQYGTGGFRRLLQEGFSCEQTHYNYSPTYTGPGHAAIYTGTVPAVNGIIANDWWDPEWKKKRYVTTDPRYKTVGGTIGKVGQHSPAVLLSSTITDELRLATRMESKVVGVCLKDRGSILPAGHFPNASYWFDDETGNWITSTYYPDSVALPQWADQFNQKKLPDTYLNQSWDKMPNAAYSGSFDGWERYKSPNYFRPFMGNFPYNLANIKKTRNYEVIRFTPFGNNLTTDFALAAVENMQLGQDNVPDFLCLSYSATDYCGHQFGIHAPEVEDTYLRLDRDIERLLTYLDEKIGRNNVLLFLTADHGGGETPIHLRDLNAPAGVFEESKLEAELESALSVAFSMSGDFIQEIANQQIWLNWDAIQDFDLAPDEVAHVIADYIRTQKGVYDVYTRDELLMLPSDIPFIPELRRGIHPRRSGDIIIHLDPAWHADDSVFKLGGATHGSPYAYDTHVPLLWYGWRVPSGESFAPVAITDIAPTLAAMLRITEPNGNIGKVIQEVMTGMKR